jgi:hypothetical protein
MTRRDDDVTLRFLKAVDYKASPESRRNNSVQDNTSGIGARASSSPM